MLPVKFRRNWCSGCRTVLSKNCDSKFGRPGWLSLSTDNTKRKRRRSDSVLWQKPLCQQKLRKPMDNTKTPPKTSITQRLRTDLGRSVGVTTVIQTYTSRNYFMRGFFFIQQLYGSKKCVNQSERTKSMMAHWPEKTLTCLENNEYFIGIGSSHFTYINCPWGWGGVKMYDLENFAIF